MSINFFAANCQTFSSAKLFGLCDDPKPASNPAYIDEKDGTKWIAVIENEDLHDVKFTAIDNCIVINRPDGKSAKRCDGFLTYNSTITFVELKQRGTSGNEWIKDAENQLKVTIGYFEQKDEAEEYKIKKAYIANSERPKFRESQTIRMEQFFDETGYILRIENRIIL